MATKILVTDDDRSVRRILRRRLETAGYKVEEASDGKQALKKYRRSAPDLVITDIVMPKLDGHGLIAELLEQDPDARIVAISGAHSRNVPELLQEAAARGALRTLHKPFTSEQLFAAIRDVLDAPRERPQTA